MPACIHHILSRIDPHISSLIYELPADIHFQTAWTFLHQLVVQDGWCAEAIQIGWCSFDVPTGLGIEMYGFYIYHTKVNWLLWIFSLKIISEVIFDMAVENASVRIPSVTHNSSQPVVTPSNSSGRKHFPKHKKRRDIGYISIATTNQGKCLDLWPVLLTFLLFQFWEALIYLKSPFYPVYISFMVYLSMMASSSPKYLLIHLDEAAFARSSDIPDGLTACNSDHLLMKL